ncbi:MAG: phosphoribosylglycinamide formyltransferase [Gallionella sp.]|nr:phosphoribosylglycinamide formyltransferase [Gallionella sp.]
MKRIVILISGRGSNMEALLKAKLPCEVAAVISNKADATGLEIARARGVHTAVVSHKDFASRDDFDAALAKEIDRHRPDLVVLAGFMRILTADFVNHYAGRLINIHPSLLPAYTGVNTHERALQDGVKIHGCTIHFVTADLDHGPIIIQAAVPVHQGDTPQTLSARVLREEHRVFPQAVRWICNGNVRLNAQGRVETDRMEQSGTTLISPGLE